jgi:mannose-6-phosphate isomerase-like protein (cupin superfamily)
MAKIILEPNETFEHFHSELSSTELLSGSANYRTDDISMELQLNEPVLTPANKSHILTNTGNMECVIGCSH